MSESAIIKIENLGFSYGGDEVLKEASFSIEERDFIGVIGPNGGGKTTLVKLILGLLKPQRGEISFWCHGKRVERFSMGYLPQYSSLDKKFPISVGEVVRSGLIDRGSLWRPLSKRQWKDAEETMERLDLIPLSSFPIGELSGGQLQRVLLARALVSHPSLLVLDEPNSYLDAHFEEQLYKELEEVNRSCAILLVSHDIGTVLQNVKSVVCVNVKSDFHPVEEVTQDWIEENIGSPLEMLRHGEIPHRILKNHSHSS